MSPFSQCRSFPSSLVGGALALLLLLGPGCAKLEKELFTRHSPTVDEAVTALRTEDAGVAVKALTDYLNTGRCKEGSIGTPDSVREYPNAAFDLGLTLFQLAERFGGKFGQEVHPGAAALPHAGAIPTAAPAPGGPPAPSPQAQALLVKRSQEVDCALRLVRVIAADSKVDPELRAEAYYLSGNLEFLRGDYGSAVDSYDDCLEWIPGGLAKEKNQVGSNAAWNRAIALKRIEEEEENKPDPPDAGKPPPSDGGGQQDESSDSDQDQKDQDQKDQDQKQQDQQDQDQKNQDEQQQDQQDKQDDKSKNDGQDQDSDNQQEQGKEDQKEQQQQGKEGHEQKQEEQAEQQQPAPSLSQDERVLQQLERAPMLQNELSKSRARGRVRLNMEDK